MKSTMGGDVFLAAVLLVSDDPVRLADFYRDILDLPLQEEAHGNTALHFGCELGAVHFAIHPRVNFPGEATVSPGNVRLAFSVFDMETFENRVRERGYVLLYAPQDAGFAIMTALHDPDGNYLEVTELSENWMRHLETESACGNDIITQWRQRLCVSGE